MNIKTSIFKNLSIGLVSIALSLTSLSSFAGSGWSQLGTITEVYSFSHTVMVKMSGNDVDHSNKCAGKGYYAIDSITPGYEYILSHILMAHASGKKVRFWINGNKCSGQSKKYQTIITVRTFTN